MRRGVLTAAAFVVVTCVAVAAGADELTISHPGEHPKYRFEAEPHGLIGYGKAFDKSKLAVGAGFRGTIIVLDDGFVPSISNSIGVGFGADFFFAKDFTVALPVVMQWDFWLSRNWSVFGEPGVAFVIGGKGVIHPFLAAGGRFHFSDTVALTLRAGYPAFSIGVSFMF